MVQSEEEARQCARFPEVRRVPTIGEELVIEPCVRPEQYPEQPTGALGERPRGNAGFPCPRSELDPDNRAAADLVYYAIDEELGRLASVAFRELTRAMDPDERAAVLGRIAAVLGDPQVAAYRRAAREVALKESRDRARENAKSVRG